MLAQIFFACANTNIANPWVYRMNQVFPVKQHVRGAPHKFVFNRKEFLFTKIKKPLRKCTAFKVIMRDMGFCSPHVCLQTKNLHIIPKGRLLDQKGYHFHPCFVVNNRKDLTKIA
jgi:hypothetical protein